MGVKSRHTTGKKTSAVICGCQECAGVVDLLIAALRGGIAPRGTQAKRTEQRWIGRT